jgi:hypothetical protein
MMLMVLVSFLSGTAQAGFWGNFKTGQPEMIRDGEAPPPDRMREFIPQNWAAQGLYQMYLDQGKTPVESATLVLESAIGRKPARE